MNIHRTASLMHSGSAALAVHVLYMLANAIVPTVARWWPTAILCYLWWRKMGIFHQRAIMFKPTRNYEGLHSTPKQHRQAQILQLETLHTKIDAS